MKVEYYDAPPSRYGDCDILVNIITKPLDTGYAVGFDVKSAFVYAQRSFGGLPL